MLSLVTPAADRALLTIEELRAVAGVTGSSDDAKLAALGLQLSDMISRDCAIQGAGVAPPTLLKETLRETFRRPRGDTLSLSRRFVAAVASVTEDGTLLAADDYELDAGAGLLFRLSDGRRRRCWGCDVAIVYDAGFAEAPGDLKYAATQAIREMLSSADRDPMLRSETVDGVGRFDWQIGGTGRDAGRAFSPTISAMLDPYRTVPVA